MMNLSAFRHRMIQAKPYYKTLAPTPVMLVGGKSAKIVKIGVRVSKKSIDMASGKPLYHVVGELASESVIREGTSELRNVSVKLHTRSTYNDSVKQVSIN